MAASSTSRTATALLVSLGLIASAWWALVGAPLAGAAPAVVKTVPAGRLTGLRYHEVQKGQTLKSIAAFYGVPAARIRSANGMVNDTVYVGARLLLDEPNPGRMTPPPSPAAAAVAGSAPGAAAGTAASAASGATYTVVAGDTLGSIAKRAGTTSAALVAANHLTSANQIRIGQQLTLPGSTAAAAPAAATYTVVAGDTLGSIAKRAGTTSAALAAANHLTSANQIRIGQQLTLAGSAPGATTTGVGKGQTGKGASAARSTVCPVKGATFTYDWGFPRADGARFHEGIDMMAPAGTPILAAVSGTVTYGSSATPGTFAVLKGSNGWQYYAAHLSKTAKGGKVSAGQVIGYVGNTGDAKGGAPHLHLEIRPLDGKPINPFPIVAAACR
ncbi:MAG: LysM peptidoglycan-binding domain-containing M23 family metallopeptidase [Acidimicrobiales bacterium]